MRQRHPQPRDLLWRARPNIEGHPRAQIEIDADVLVFPLMGKFRQQPRLEIRARQLVIRQRVLVEQESGRSEVRGLPSELAQHAAHWHIGVMTDLLEQTHCLPQVAADRLSAEQQTAKDHRILIAADLIRRAAAHAVPITGQHVLGTGQPEQEQMEGEQQQMIESDAEVTGQPAQSRAGWRS